MSDLCDYYVIHYAQGGITRQHRVITDSPAVALDTFTRSHPVALVLSVSPANECPRCGQRSTAYETLCGQCVDADHMPQGETVRLFEPAATQLEGQLSM